MVGFHEREDESESTESGPWPAFADLLSATTLLFLILFAAIAVPAIGRVRLVERQLRERESTIQEIEARLLTARNELAFGSQVEIRRVGDYIRISIRGEATFPKDADQLGDLQLEGRQILARLGQTINRINADSQRIDQVQVVGHTSHEGTEERNWRLSASRAATVALYLIESVHVHPCTVTALGRSRYYPQNPDHVRRDSPDPLDRRIELEIRPVIKEDEEQARRRASCVAEGE